MEKNESLIEHKNHISLGFAAIWSVLDEIIGKGVNAKLKK